LLFLSSFSFFQLKSGKINTAHFRCEAVLKNESGEKVKEGIAGYQSIVDIIGF
jgi:hypothetical protein